MQSNETPAADAPAADAISDEAHAREGAELLATLVAEDAAAAAAAALAEGPLPLVEQIPLPNPQQGEMPFAIVDGEPLTEPPKDLYIPPQALKVFLEAFEGPLDLLLYLIRRQNLDILDIPIAEITRQYLEYIDLMQTLELELAGEYLLMAAMLAEIKSRLLLPRPSSVESEEDDPRADSCVVCKSTSATRRPPRISIRSSGSTATCTSPRQRSPSARWSNPCPI